MKTYTPLPQTELNLAPTTRRNERLIHELIVAFPGTDLQERAAICEIEGWKPEERIPEMAESTRISVDSLKVMLNRLEGKPNKLEKELKALVEKFHKPGDVKKVSSDEYWLQLANILFEDFPADAKADDLNLREIQKAYEDFHEG